MVLVRTLLRWRGVGDRRIRGSLVRTLKLLAGQSSTLGGVAILFFGGILSLRIYDSVNRRAEKRQLRQEYALSRVKDIYAPLWDETALLMDLAERYEAAELLYGGAEREEIGKRGYAHVMKGPLRLSIDSDLAVRLSGFHATLPPYNRAYSLARNTLYEKTKVAVREFTGRPESDGPTSELANLLMGNDRLIWGATDFGEDATRFMRERFREICIRIPELGDDVDADLDQMVSQLRSLYTAEALRAASRKCVASGQLVIQRLEEILRDPASVVLEFGG